MVVIMAQRDEVFHKFGPILLEACLLIVYTEVNIIRGHLGLAPRTLEQFLDQVNNHIATLDPYDWQIVEDG